MPESRGRRPKNPTPQDAGSTAANTRTKTTVKETDSPKAAAAGLRPLELWKNVWAVLGPAVALTGFAFLLWPQVRIEPGASLDFTDALTTQFRVTNSGNVPVYEIRFGCDIGIRAAYTHFGDS